MSKQVNAHIMMNCMDVKHRNCEKLRNTLVDTIYEVKEAETVTQINGESDFCVIGVARIAEKKATLFKSALKRLDNRTKKDRDVRIYLEEEE